MLYLLIMLQAVGAQPSSAISPAHPPVPHMRGGAVNYPAAALRNGQEGIADFRLEIDADGVVTACRITKSSGWEALDQATCPQVRMLFDFTPATDAQGKPVAAAYENHLKWKIPRG